MEKPWVSFQVCPHTWRQRSEERIAINWYTPWTLFFCVKVCCINSQTPPSGIISSVSFFNLSFKLIHFFFYKGRPAQLAWWSSESSLNFLIGHSVWLSAEPPFPPPWLHQRDLSCTLSSSPAAVSFGKQKSRFLPCTERSQSFLPLPSLNPAEIRAIGTEVKLINNRKIICQPKAIVLLLWHGAPVFKKYSWMPQLCQNFYLLHSLLSLQLPPSLLPGTEYIETWLLSSPSTKD